MSESRRTLVGIWALTTLVVLGAALLYYRQIIQVPLLAGRTEPADIYDNPAALFEDPGLLGSAIEVRVTKAVRSCMESRGLTYRGPAVVEDLDGLLGSDSGYGIAAGPTPPGTELGDGGPRSSEGLEYELALYGAALGDSGSGEGCAAAGQRELDDLLVVLSAMPYSIDQLEADAWAHPASVEALSAWVGCMAIRGHDVSSPLDLIVAQTELLSRVSGEEARRLADEERALAADDRGCRRDTFDQAISLVAADLGPRFVDRNRSSLETLIPPTVNPFDDGDVDRSLGTGDIQVTLRWASAVDLDLEVVDPEGFEIDFSTRTSTSGGQLDRDANYPCGSVSDDPVENIFWPTGAAPSGSYRVVVTYRTTCDDLGLQPFELVVRLGGRVVLREAGELDPGATLTFNFGFPA
jgi:hypothetical protein